jgi:hypothetical protein
LFNYTLTAADKSPLTGFVPITSVTLFKRGFRPVNGFVFAPLEKDVIYDMLHWCKDPAHATATTIERALDALTESVHHGRELYDTILDLLNDVMRRAHIPWTPVSYESVLITLRSK